MKLLEPETRENVRENVEEGMENQTRSFYTPTRSVRISSTQNDQDISRNNIITTTLYQHIDQPRRLPHVKFYLPKRSQYGKRASQS